jgi:phosphoribosylformylglycinamidine synthase
MLFTVEVKIMPLKELLDPQGKAVMGGLSNLGIVEIKDVRVGKNVILQIEAGDANTAVAAAENAAKKLLANQVMEYFEVRVL